MLCLRIMIRPNNKMRRSYSGVPYRNPKTDLPLPHEIETRFVLVKANTNIIHASFGDGICCNSGEAHYRYHTASASDGDQLIAEGGEFNLKAQRVLFFSFHFYLLH